MNEKLASRKGGAVILFDETGEVFVEIAVPGGLHDWSTYADMIPPGGGYKLEGLILIQPAQRSGIAYSDGHFETAANADFVPRSQEQRTMALMAQKVAQLERFLRRNADRVSAIAETVIEPVQPDGQESDAKPAVS